MKSSLRYILISSHHNLLSFSEANINQSTVQGITKGSVAQEVLSSLTKKGKSPDFVLCIGDDRSDEDMFESILAKPYSATSFSAPQIFACTVGQKPSKARYYLDDTVDVMTLLKGLGAASGPKSRCSTETPFEKREVCFENDV